MSQYAEAFQMLDAWGRFVTTNRPMFSETQEPGRKKAFDEDRRKGEYVEQTLWFASTRPVLLHIHAKGLPYDTYAFRTPGEDGRDAIMRHGLGQEHYGKTDKSLTAEAYNRFVKELAARMISTPLAALIVGEEPDGTDEGVTDAEREHFLRVAREEREAANKKRDDLVLKVEYQFFLANLKEWMKDHKDEFCLIKGEELIGFSKTFEDALGAGYYRFPCEAFFVHKVETPKPAFLTACRPAKSA